MMPASAARRPANRPSRRHEILAAAIELFAVQAPESITVSDIASHAGMTSAAFYYHFGGKDELLEEIVEDVSTRWAHATSSALRAVRSDADLAEFIRVALDWLDAHEAEANVYFIGSIGASASIERTRRARETEVVTAASKAIRRISRHRTATEAAVGGVALVTMLSIAARSRLLLDEAFRALGPARFRTELAAIAATIVA